MSLDLTRQELSFQRRVRAFTEKSLRPLAAKIEAEEYLPSDFLRTLGKNRFLGAPFSRSDGGLGLGWASETIVAEEVSAVSGAAEMARLASAALHAAPIAYFGNSVQKKRFLRPVLSGERIGAVALTEPRSGSDAGSIKTRAKRDRRDFVLNGEKRFITTEESRTISSSSRLLIPASPRGPGLARSSYQGIRRVLKL